MALKKHMITSLITLIGVVVALMFGLFGCANTDVLEDGVALLTQEVSSLSSKITSLEQTNHTLEDALTSLEQRMELLQENWEEHELTYDVTDLRPRAAFLYSPSNPQAGNAISFHNKTTRAGVVDLRGLDSYWEFGDGATSLQVEPEHIYDNPGSYEVTLTVIDSEGNSSRAFGLAAIGHQTGAETELGEFDTPIPIYITWLDVADGESIVIDYGDYEMLIDGGSTGEDVTDYLTRVVQGNLEVVVATHMDEDHIGGLGSVLDEFSVEEIWTTGATHRSDTYDEFMEKVANEGLSEGAIIQEARQGMTIQLNDLHFRVLGPTRAIDDNNGSIVLDVRIYDTDFLFLGDLEESGQQELLLAGLVAEVEIMQMPHHGLSSALNPHFLALASPEVAVFSSRVLPTEDVLREYICGGFKAEVFGTLNQQNVTVIVTPDEYVVSRSGRVAYDCTICMSCEECLDVINSASRADFMAINGIAETLTGYIMEKMPYHVYGRCTEGSLLAALQKATQIGPARSRQIVDNFCGSVCDE